MKRIILSAIFFTGSLILTAQSYQATWQSIDSRPVPAWFRSTQNTGPQHKFFKAS
jgi:hypothetical protein